MSINHRNTQLSGSDSGKLPIQIQKQTNVMTQTTFPSPLFASGGPIVFLGSEQWLLPHWSIPAFLYILSYIKILCLQHTYDVNRFCRLSIFDLLHNNLYVTHILYTLYIYEYVQYVYCTSMHIVDRYYSWVHIIHVLYSRYTQVLHANYMGT